MPENYSLTLEKTISEIKKNEVHPSLLLHACCAPCSSYVLEYLTQYFNITLFFYNPNIYPEREFSFRLAELERFSSEAGYNVPIVSPDYDPAEFFDMARGMEDFPEGGERCKKCYELRLRKTAEAASSGHFEYFTTTLSISPYKNALWLNEIGGELGEEYGIKYLFSDFKKKNGYKRSIELSHEYKLYRQDYCGCVYSKAEAEKRKSLDKTTKHAIFKNERDN